MNELVLAGRPNAVRYVRVSTEHQRYSLEHQSDLISSHAIKCGYNLISTYTDEGRSGLTIAGREGLVRLLHDVTNPQRTFSIILVLDVSRWGRFQDVDQHAAYEFICRDMGVRIEYVNEAFANDDSVATSLLKHMKRIMASEYSRELSSKVSRAAVATAERGFKQGGPLPIGYRRMLVSGDGTHQRILQAGEQKSLTSDKVVIVPGPKEEVAIIRRIFRLFTRDRFDLRTIARKLNNDGVAADSGGVWTARKIKGLLTNTLNIGVYSYNKTTTRLKTKKTKNPEAMWVKVRVGKPIISEQTFGLAKRLLLRRPTKYTKSEMLAGAGRLLKAKGRLSSALIACCPDIPGPHTYARQFGSLSKLYELLGYQPDTAHQRHACKMIRNKSRKFTRDELLDGLKRLLAEKGELSGWLIQQCPYTASLSTYPRRFGSMRLAYAAIGYSKGYLNSGRKSYWDAHQDLAIKKLRALYDRNGYVTTALVEADPELPATDWFRHRFGTFTNACAAAGITLSHGEQVAEGYYRMMSRYAKSKLGEPVVRRSKVKLGSDEELIAGIKRLYQEHGRVTANLIDDDPFLPTTYRIYERYASLKHLYVRAGIPNVGRLGGRRSRETFHAHPPSG